LAPDVVLISPLTEQFRFTGAEEVRLLLTEAFAVIDDIRFHTQILDDRAGALFYRARVADQVLDEAQLLRFDAAGRIAEITLFARPLPALTGLMAALGPRLARAQKRTSLAVLLKMATLPLNGMARSGEKRILPMSWRTAR
jgi:hypothetical protein